MLGTMTTVTGWISIVILVTVSTSAARSVLTNWKRNLGITFRISISHRISINVSTIRDVRFRRPNTGFHREKIRVNSTAIFLFTITRHIWDVGVNARPFIRAIRRTSRLPIFISSPIFINVFDFVIFKNYTFSPNKKPDFLNDVPFKSFANDITNLR